MTGEVAMGTSDSNAWVCPSFRKMIPNLLRAPNLVAQTGPALSHYKHVLLLPSVTYNVSRNSKEIRERERGRIKKSYLSTKVSFSVSLRSCLAACLNLLFYLDPTVLLHQCFKWMSSS